MHKCNIYECVSKLISLQKKNGPTLLQSVKASTVICLLNKRHLPRKNCIRIYLWPKIKKTKQKKKEKEKKTNKFTSNKSLFVVRKVRVKAGFGGQLESS